MIRKCLAVVIVAICSAMGCSTGITDVYSCSDVQRGRVDENGSPAPCDEEGRRLYDACEGECTPKGKGFFANDSFLLWIGSMADVPPECPKEAPDTYLYDLYSDLDAPNECGVCQCGAPSCVFPSGVTASNTALCQGPTFSDFDAPAGWTGACAAPASIPGNLVDSVTIKKTSLAPCPLITLPEPKNLPFRWKTRYRSCQGTAYGQCTDNGANCVPGRKSASEFRQCIQYSGPSDREEPCPAEYKERHVAYAGIDDQRGCTPCQCGAPTGSDCRALVTLYDNDTCLGIELGSANTTLDVDACQPIVPPDAPLKAMTAAWVSNEPGQCQVTGGEPTGQATPSEPVIFCCQPLP